MHGSMRMSWEKGHLEYQEKPDRQDSSLASRRSIREKMWGESYKKQTRRRKE